ncbi:thiamine transporter Thi9 [Schizosaccharomyces japonicus yFS275]|uniref:Thiamine transporter Thi9 n=1 Tax=Schizosaccharomyces japonicus (strain yFS275 / FY16936) TaxID=402676 RepID=B6K7G3_SCHJY|nr:thiamine transporter Thi9 [Schizosaccharomyces japonicus yFS275]EEB09467.1 thiamine transporter Thi9 [Schizosaccharomyces japonicus yFS275]
MSFRAAGDVAARGSFDAGGASSPEKDQASAIVTPSILENNGSQGTPSYSEMDEDEAQLKKLGYKPILHRSFALFESFAATFAALDVVGGVRLTMATGISFAGPASYWSSFVITAVCSIITAAVLAEVCSALPASGSIYLWAAESGGKVFGRFLSFLVAWWSTTAWTTFVASMCQSTMNFVFAEVSVFNGSYKTDVSDVKFRAVQWITSEVVLLFVILLNYVPPRLYKLLFRISMAIIAIDYILNIVWVPIATSKKDYGFRSAKWVFTQTYYNYAGTMDDAGTKPVPKGWQWCLTYFATAGILCGYDASGHIAEETKNASVKAARGLFWSTVVSAVCAFSLIIMFLFCMPPDTTFFDLIYSATSTQPVVNLYAYMLGRGGHVVMNVICIIELFMNAVVSVLACSRLVFAVARDGVLPFSSWIGQVDKNGQPRNAITVIYICSCILLCSILPSNVAFTSLVSAAGAPSFAAYTLIAFGRLFLSRNNFPKGKWDLGILKKPFYFVAMIFNAFAFIVNVSPYSYPVKASNFNYAIVIMAIVSICAVLCTIFIPRSKWLATRSPQDGYVVPHGPQESPVQVNEKGQWEK